MGKIPLTSTGLDVKKLIARYKGIPVEQQLLFFPRVSQRLEDEDSIGDALRLTDAVGTVQEPLQLTAFSKTISLRILGPDSFDQDLLMKTYPCYTVRSLKRTIERHTRIPMAEQTLSYNGVAMADDKLLVDYNLKDPEDSFHILPPEEANATTTSKPFEVHLFSRKNSRGRLALGIDFSFNTIKDVKKVAWKPTAPVYCEVTDGVSWFCYCRNAKCAIANELFVVNRGEKGRRICRFRTFLSAARLAISAMSCVR